MTDFSARNPERAAHKCTQCAFCSYSGPTPELLDRHFVDAHLAKYLDERILTFDVEVASSSAGPGAIFSSGGAQEQESEVGHGQLGE
eukprot:659228-Pyramimonas_sp.AAC.1